MVVVFCDEVLVRLISLEKLDNDRTASQQADGVFAGPTTDSDGCPNRNDVAWVALNRVTDVVPHPAGVVAFPWRTAVRTIHDD